MKTKLGAEEKDVLEAFEAGKTKPTRDAAKMLAKHQKYAAGQVRRDRKQRSKNPHGRRDLSRVRKVAEVVRGDLEDLVHMDWSKE